MKENRGLAVKMVRFKFTDFWTGVGGVRFPITVITQLDQNRPCDAAFLQKAPTPHAPP
jgi:hypothetical protein